MLTIISNRLGSNAAASFLRSTLQARSSPVRHGKAFAIVIASIAKFQQAITPRHPYHKGPWPSDRGAMRGHGPPLADHPPGTTLQLCSICSFVSSVWMGWSDLQTSAAIHAEKNPNLQLLLSRLQPVLEVDAHLIPGHALIACL